MNILSGSRWVWWRLIALAPICGSHGPPPDHPVPAQRLRRVDPRLQVKPGLFGHQLRGEQPVNLAEAVVRATASRAAFEGEMLPLRFGGSARSGAATGCVLREPDGNLARDLCSDLASHHPGDRWRGSAFRRGCEILPQTLQDKIGQAEAAARSLSRQVGGGDHPAERDLESEAACLRGPRIYPCGHGRPRGHNRASCRATKRSVELVKPLCGVVGLWVVDAHLRTRILRPGPGTCSTPNLGGSPFRRLSEFEHQSCRDLSGQDLLEAGIDVLDPADVGDNTGAARGVQLEYLRDVKPCTDDRADD